MSKQGVENTKQAREYIKKHRKGLVYVVEDGIITKKQCSFCKNVKTLEDFGIQKFGLGGRRSTCLLCKRGEKKRPASIPRKWSEERVIEEIKHMYKNGVPLDMEYQKKNNNSLLYACSRYVGSWKQAVEKAGIDYETVSLKHYKSKEEVLTVIKDIFKIGGSLSYSDNRDSSLQKSACHYFGSWGNAVTLAGIDYSVYLKSKAWLDEEIYSEIKNLYTSDVKKIGARNMVINHCGLYGAAVRKFGTWEKAVESIIGVNYEKEVLTTKRWSREKVTQEINRIKKCGEPLNISYIMINFRALEGAARTHFGSWENALDSAGIQYKDVVEDRFRATFFGREFEKMTDELLRDVGIDYRKYAHQKWRPDYVTKRDIWVDAKLSQWTVFESETISRYEDCCNLLMIVYMRGNKDKDEMITPKTRLMSVHKLIKQLPRHRQRYYLNWVNEIETEMNEIGNRSSDESQAVI